MEIQRWLMAALAAGGCCVAGAQTPDALYTRSLAATCANCHGTDGRSVTGSSAPPLAGMPRDYIASQLKAFKAGTRPATIMHQLSKGYSDAQIEQIATYFAQRK
ncbi:c-type cytochrome [Caenimonas sp. SL110]|uniref:c-type cytochrome n=1 Tax=Caenimonas sp. SL110 TaxID=1450524 RepID=UPI000AFF98B0|nr:c-type cytochrome [Caenimonas sp. SL110]